jgi:hypothetical protein
MEVNAMHEKMRKPGPSLVIATAALFVALGGTAGAVVDAAVPLAKRALVADNAKKLGGKNEAAIVSEAVAQAVPQAVDQAAERPGPASTAAGLVATKTASNSIGARAQGEFTASCDSGKKVIGGGYSTDGNVLGFDSRPTNETTWSVYLLNGGSSSASVTIYAICIA